MANIGSAFVVQGAFEVRILAKAKIDYSKTLLAKVNTGNEEQMKLERTRSPRILD